MLHPERSKSRAALLRCSPRLIIIVGWFCNINASSPASAACFRKGPALLHPGDNQRTAKPTSSGHSTTTLDKSSALYLTIMEARVHSDATDSSVLSALQVDSALDVDVGRFDVLLRMHDYVAHIMYICKQTQTPLCSTGLCQYAVAVSLKAH